MAGTLCEGGEERTRSFCSRSSGVATVADDAATGGGGGGGWVVRGVGGGPSVRREATFMANRYIAAAADYRTVVVVVQA